MRDSYLVDVVSQFVEIDVSNNAALIDLFHDLSFRMSEVGSVDKVKLNALSISVL